ncbi:phospholipase A2 inhibitor gamma subunit B-like [Carettochelys insculpta]|uniref:phospholipase A2 inhibitor gamma subunit B-like n=1 Tax=Carettochelys insculpta TaxID=44489 RepID=UPI003EB7C689
MKASPAVCVLAALLATGSCLQCEVCSGTGNNCTGRMRPCATGPDTCGIFLTEVTLMGMKTLSVVKGCVTSSQCGTGPVSMNFGNEISLMTVIACCVGDACRTVNATLPAPDTKPNGRWCLGCYELTTETCREEPIECTGTETQCIDAAGTIATNGSPQEMIMKGCVSASICANLKAGLSTFAGIVWNMTTDKCTAASGMGDVHPRGAEFLLPALTGFLLLLNLLP